MHNRIYTYCFIALCGLMSAGVLSACGDTGSGEQSAATAGETPVATQKFSPTLSASDLADDTVFNDGSKPVSWRNAGFSDSVKVKQFIRNLQIWADQNLVDSIAN